MRNNIMRMLPSKALVLGGMAFILTGMLVILAEPSKVTIFTTNYSGDQIVLSSVLVLMGYISMATGRKRSYE